MHNDCPNATYNPLPEKQVLKLNSMIKNDSNWGFLYWKITHLNDENNVTF